MRSPVYQQRLRRLGLVCLLTFSLCTLFFFPPINATPAQAHRLSIIGNFTPVSGIDTTSGSPTPLTVTDITRLSASDDTRQVSDGNWPMIGAYDENIYIEYV